MIIRIQYPSETGGLATANFADPKRFGAWFLRMERDGRLSREEPNAFRLSQLDSDGGESPLDIMHPALVEGRLGTRPA